MKKSCENCARPLYKQLIVLQQLSVLYHKRKKLNETPNQHAMIALLMDYVAENISDKFLLRAFGSSFI